MPRPSRPKVFDPRLREVLDEVGPHIENYHENLNAISSDIKAVEQYLIGSGVRLTAYVRIRYSESMPDGESWDVAGNYSGAIHRDVENIEWTEIDDGRWRLCYVKFRRFGEIELCERIAIAGPTFSGANELLETKPLIETPVEIRLLAHKHLTTLLKRVAELVEVRPLGQAVPNDDILS